MAGKDRRRVAGLGGADDGGPARNRKWNFRRVGFEGWRGGRILEGSKAESRRPGRRGLPPESPLSREGFRGGAIIAWGVAGAATTTRRRSASSGRGVTPAFIEWNLRWNRAEIPPRDEAGHGGRSVPPAREPRSAENLSRVDHGRDRRAGPECPRFCGNRRRGRRDPVTNRWSSPEFPFDGDVFDVCPNSGPRPEVRVGVRWVDSSRVVWPNRCL